MFDSYYCDGVRCTDNSNQYCSHVGTQFNQGCALSEKYRGIKSDCIIYRDLLNTAVYRPAVVIGRQFVKRFAMLSVLCPICLSVCDVRALWPNGWTDQDETWRAGRSRPWPHCVRWGPSSPLLEGHSLPVFGPYLLRPNGCMDQDAIWYGGRPHPWGLFMLDGDPVPLNFRPMLIIVVVISLEHCTVVIGLFKFKFQYSMHSIFRKKSLILLGLFQYKYDMHSCTPSIAPIAEVGVANQSRFRQ